VVKVVLAVSGEMFSFTGHCLISLASNTCFNEKDLNSLNEVIDIGSVEVRAFGKLSLLLKEHGRSNPLQCKYTSSLTAEELRKRLEIPHEDVEVVFINRLIKPLSTSLSDGDRIAFVPPGVPSIHRYNLGFYSAAGEKTRNTDNKND